MDKRWILREWIGSSRHMVFFGGAGVSTESGIPDFRSTDGLYHQKFSYPPERILSHSFFFAETEAFYRFYREKMLVTDARPNRAHTILASLEKTGTLSAVITQNIDGLHQKAGSVCVMELHGSVHRNYCLRCGKFYTGNQLKEMDPVPHCTCGGLIKPDVVLYEEGLDRRCMENSIRAIGEADLLIVGGSGLTVYPAAGLLRYYEGSRLVLINRDETSFDSRADLVFRESIGAVLEAAVSGAE